MQQWLSDKQLLKNYFSAILIYKMPSIQDSKPSAWSVSLESAQICGAATPSFCPKSSVSLRGNKVITTAGLKTKTMCTFMQQKLADSVWLFYQYLCNINLLILYGCTINIYGAKNCRFCMVVLSILMHHILSPQIWASQGAAPWLEAVEEWRAENSQLIM